MLKRTPLRKISKKQKVRIEEGKEEGKKDREMYAEIWKEKEHICYESGDKLGGEALTIYFHHVLPKEDNKFPQYRHMKWNIILLSPRIHNMIETFGMSRTPKVHKLYLELLEKHYNFAENQ